MLLQLQQIVAAHDRIIIQAFQVRFVPAAHPLEICLAIRPRLPRRLRASAAKPGQSFDARAGGLNVPKTSDRTGAQSKLFEEGSRR